MVNCPTCGTKLTAAGDLLKCRKCKLVLKPEGERYYVVAQHLPDKRRKK